jgi:hypothetical protein
MIAKSDKLQFVVKCPTAALGAYHNLKGIPGLLEPQRITKPLLGVD